MTDQLNDVIHTIWTSILNRTEVNVGDNFFELGGTSLDGSHMLAEVRRRVSATVRIRDLLENPTLSQFTDRVRVLAEVRQGTRS